MHHRASMVLAKLCLELLVPKFKTILQHCSSVREQDHSRNWSALHQSSYITLVQDHLDFSSVDPLDLLAHNSKRVQFFFDSDSIEREDYYSCKLGSRICQVVFDLVVSSSFACSSTCWQLPMMMMMVALSRQIIVPYVNDCFQSNLD